MKGILITIIVLIGIAGCKKKDNSNAGLLNQEKMQAVLWDFIGADVFTEQFIKKDSSKNATVENMQLQNKIFALHNISRNDFFKSYDYYISHTDLIRVILDSMTVKAERERTKIFQDHHHTRPHPLPVAR